MQELEKILEDINENTISLFSGVNMISAKKVEKILRKHMNDGWISVNSHGLPSSSEHDFRFWVTVQYKNGFRRTLKATWNYYNNHFVYQNGKIISEDVVAYRYYSAPKPYQPERSEG